MQSISSKEVAEMIGVRHDNFLRNIRKYVEMLGGISNATEYFTEGSYADTSGKKRFGYLLTKKGCDFVASRLNLGKGVAFKEAIDALEWDEVTTTGAAVVSVPVQPVAPQPEVVSYSIKEAAKLLGMSERSVYRNVESGKLKTFQKEVVSTVTAVTEEALEEFKKVRAGK